MKRLPWLLVALLAIGVFAGQVLRDRSSDSFQRRPPASDSPGTAEPASAPEERRIETAADGSLILQRAGLQAVFNASGVTLRCLGERLSWQWAQVDGLDPSSDASLWREGANVLRQAGPVRERWENRADGIEHSIVVSADPNQKTDASNLSGELTVRINLEGVLQPRVGEDCVLFADSAGRDLLAYRGLRVNDALGRPLPARFDVADQTITVKVRYLEAVYPIVIDPVLTRLSSGPSGKAPKDPPNMLYRWRAGNVGGATIGDLGLQYRVFFTDTWTWKRTYVDFDRNSNTGFRYQGLGADFLIEGDTLYVYTGLGTNWSWSPISPSSLMRTEGTLNGQAFVKWDLHQSEYDRLGQTNDVNLLFEVEKPGAISTGVVYRHVYTQTGGAASDQYAENDPANIYCHVRLNAAGNYHHVFIDSDNLPGTGYPMGGIGADYLIENDFLYQYTGPYPDWGWAPIGNANLVVTDSPLGGQNYDWSIARSDIGVAEAFGDRTNIVFEGNWADGSVQYSTPVYAHVFSPGTIGNGWSLRNSGTVQNLYGISFVNGTNGWIVGGQGTILRTTDGGDTWIPQNSGTTTDLHAVKFVSTTTGWVVGDRGIILRTMNGGSNWTQQPTGTAGDFRGVSFVDANNGWAIGPGVYQTSNGGTTWSQQPSGIGGRGIIFTDTLHGWLATSVADTVYGTTDGGATWAGQSGSAATDGSRAITMVNSTTGWAVGIGGSILHSTDGATWSMQSPPSSFGLVGGEFLGVSFVDTSNGWYVGMYSQIAFTVDGGANWLTQQVGGHGAPDLNGVQFIDTSTGWIVGNGGLILKTTTGGRRSGT